VYEKVVEFVHGAATSAILVNVWVELSRAKVSDTFSGIHDRTFISSMSRRMEELFEFISFPNSGGISFFCCHDPNSQQTREWVSKFTAFPPQTGIQAYYWIYLF
jgi:hypothetical protein